MPRIIFVTTDAGDAKIRADADKRGLTLTEHISKKLGVKPPAMGRPPKKEPDAKPKFVGPWKATYGGGYDPRKPYGPGNRQEP